MIIKIKCVGATRLINTKHIVEVVFCEMDDSSEDAQISIFYDCCEEPSVIEGRTEEIRRLLNFIENRLSDAERIETFTFAEESKRERDRDFDDMFPEEHIGDLYVPKPKV